VVSSVELSCTRKYSERKEIVLLPVYSEYMEQSARVILLIMIKMAEEAIQRNYLKEDLGWISEICIE